MKDVKSILAIALSLTLSQVFKNVPVLCWIFIALAILLMIAWIMGSVIWIKKNVK